MSLELDELSAVEERLRIRRSGSPTDAELRELHAEYRELHRAYVSWMGDRARSDEALKRALFLQWYSLCEPP